MELELADQKVAFIPACYYPYLYEWGFQLDGQPLAVADLLARGFKYSTAHDTIKIQTSNLFYEGTYTFSYSVSYNGYPVDTYPFYSEYKVAKSFDVGMIDPCKTSSFDFTENEIMAANLNFYAIIGPESREF